MVLYLRKRTITSLLRRIRIGFSPIRLIRRFLLIFATSAIFWLFLIPESPFITEQQPSSSPSIWRTCCRAPEENRDICGVKMCSKPCPSRPSLFDIREEENYGRRQAFFLETYGAGELNIRQACTVESLARLNPNLTVNVLFVDADVKEETSTLQSLRAEYPNVHLMRMDSQSLIAGTPLDKWYFCTKWREGPFHVAHLSDALRLLILYLYGGYYFDLDIVFVQPLPAELTNFIVAENSYYVANGILHFDRNHPFTLLALHQFTENYRSYSWGHNGPILLSRMLETWCNLRDMPNLPVLETFVNGIGSSMICGEHEKAIKILHSKTFFPISFDQWMKYFDDPPDLEDLDDRLIGAHVWNKLSSKHIVHKTSNGLYVTLARNFCPKIFSIALNGF